MDNDPLVEICQALCDPENQPHQWMGDVEGLESVIVDIFGCEKDAEWVLYGTDPDVFYSCTEHLSLMVDENTVNISHVEKPFDDKCSFIN